MLTSEDAHKIMNNLELDEESNNALKGNWQAYVLGPESKHPSIRSVLSHSSYGYALYYALSSTAVSAVILKPNSAEQM